jgi:GH24 family phage-related lysozyme (muramidase)
MTQILTMLGDKGPEMVIFLGMLAVVIYALRIAHDLAKIVLKNGMPLPPAAPVVVSEPKAIPVPSNPTPTPAPVPTPTPTSPVSTQPADIVDQGLVNFIKKAEGFQAKAYWDYKQYSIGYGTKANSATEVITEAEAEARLTVEVDKAYQLVKPIIPAGTPVGVVQALVDLTYNAGSGWETQSLGAAVKAAKWDTVKADILLYNHAGGVVNAGLTARREAEVSWFDNPL